LKDIHNELIEIHPVGDSVRSFRNICGQLRRQSAKLAVDPRGARLDESERADKLRLQAIAPDGKVLYRALRLSAVECMHGYADFAHGVAFDPVIRLLNAEGPGWDIGGWKRLVRGEVDAIVRNRPESRFGVSRFRPSIGENLRKRASNAHFSQNTTTTPRGQALVSNIGPLSARWN
jgi:hypothetical protein